MPPYSIRLAATSDAAAIAQCNSDMALETEGLVLDSGTILAGVSNLMAHPERGYYLVIEHEGRIVASLMVTTEWSDWRNGCFWWIQSVYVVPDYRRKGLYSLLYGDVKRRARAAEGICGFRLYVEQDNQIAQQTYRSLGMDKTRYLLFEEMVS